MMRGICGLVLFLVGCSMVHGQSAAINSTLNDIRNFQLSAVDSLTNSWNTLRDDVYGHFFRSQSTLRLARLALSSAASKFPYNHLSNETRQNLVNNLTSIIIDCIDPTVDYLQKNSTLRYFNFMNDSETPIERAFNVSGQLQELSNAILASNDSECFRRENIGRRLSNEYSALISAINDCTRNASATYRAPINEFTRVHFAALPLITRLGVSLNQCANGNNREACIVRYLAANCAGDSCKTCSTITAVLTQSQNMVNTTQQSFDECLVLAQGKVPAATPLLDRLNKCVTDSNLTTTTSAGDTTTSSSDTSSSTLSNSI